MSSARWSPEQASTLVVTLLTLSALSLMAAAAATRIFPRLPIAYQNAAWQESHVAAEAGIDAAMSALHKNLTGGAPNSWPGWTDGPGPNEPLKDVVAGLLSPVNDLLNFLLGSLFPAGPVTTSNPIYLDNLNVSAVSGVATDVDVQLWALQSASGSGRTWFRIRSTATCGLPPMAYTAPEKLDPPLRRLSLHNVRPSLQKEFIGQPSTVPLPNVSRTVEALVQPILPFELALWTSGALSLASTGAWNVDSYDSTRADKSLAGLYPGRGHPFTQNHGHVASSQARPASARYGPLIAANGTRVAGAVATNGGDDPATSFHENVSAAIGLDESRIRDDFSRAMNPVRRPASGTLLPPPPLLGAYAAGTSAAPTKYLVPGTVTSLRITGPLLGTGLIVIFIDGDLLLSGPLIIPPNVTAVVFVRGNIAFHDNVNAGPWNSNKPGQLLLFADAPGPAHQRLDAYGDITVCAAFYGPKCDVAVEGGVCWSGSIAASQFQVTSGGDGGLHYDESLATLGPPIGFRVIRCVEDVRE